MLLRRPLRPLSRPITQTVRLLTSIASLQQLKSTSAFTRPTLIQPWTPTTRLPSAATKPTLIHHFSTESQQQPPPSTSTTTTRTKKRSGFFSKLFKATLVGGVLFVGYGCYLLRDEEERSWQLLMWKTLPLRFMSHIWGSVHRIELPVALRKPLYMAWTRAFDCQLQEIADGGASTLESFPNLNAFFIRRIDLAKFRPLAKDEMISPVDGRVNVFGEVTPDGRVEQIKGMEYRVDDLLGFKIPELKKDSKLYYYVFYLAPGDYHRMHTPADCTITERRHFPGALYPVLPAIAKYIPSLFVRNERVVLNGEWAHGFFAMVPVGAYNVGSMKLTFDQELDTNLREHTFTQYRPNLQDDLKAQPFYRSYRAPTSHQLQQTQQSVGAAEKKFVQTDIANTAQTPQILTTDKYPTPTNVVGQHVAQVDADGVHLQKGDEFSRFELGSTIVVFFELDKNQTFNWNIEMDQKVRLGQRLGVILPPPKQTK